jgi:hypothetical protein
MVRVGGGEGAAPLFAVIVWKNEIGYDDSFHVRAMRR